MTFLASVAFILGLVVCVINAGAWENWRPDSGAYDRRVVGSNYAGWQGERWVDIRAADVVRPIVAKRLDLCQSKGFDGSQVHEMLDFHL